MIAVATLYINVTHKDGKLELLSLNSQAGAWELAKQLEPKRWPATPINSICRTVAVNVLDLSWRLVDGATLELGFTLPAGSHATSALREIVEF